MVKNRFNNLTSKEWLPFQKSWFKFSDLQTLYRDNIRFFTQFNENYTPNVYFVGATENAKIFETIATDCNCKPVIELDKIDKLDFVVIDLLYEFEKTISIEHYKTVKQKVTDEIKNIYDLLDYRKFVAIFIKNVQSENIFYPFIWDIAKTIADILTLKDEKIACLENNQIAQNSDYFKTAGNSFYCLYFRKDEFSQKDFETQTTNYVLKNEQQPTKLKFETKPTQWFILKPQPRKKNEILHPAKYPEELVDRFINILTNENENVFDPMSGTGSTQISALQNKRNAYGCELSEFFTEIAHKRLKDFIENNNSHFEFKIINKDARFVNQNDFPEIDYIITSPPYWDMLNMKGAENQAKRKEKGLQLNYSNDSSDLGNISDYKLFVSSLCEIYENVFKLLKPGRFATIIVKNIKKKGKNYPLAWDLSAELQKQNMVLLSEQFWCQDDLSIAPFGYGNTWVSNTFHHYCLTFQKQ